jgi:hypothetical protein
MPGFAGLPEFLETGIGEAGPEIDGAPIHLIASVRRMRSLIVKDCGHTAIMFLGGVVVFVDGTLDELGCKGPELLDRDPHCDLAPGTNMDPLSKDLLSCLSHRLGEMVLGPWSGTGCPEVVAEWGGCTGMVLMGFVVEPLSKGHHKNQILGHELGHLGEKEPSGPARGIAAVTGLVIVENKQHLTVMEEEIPGVEQGVPPADCQKFGPSCLLPRSDKERPNEGL